MLSFKTWLGLIIGLQLVLAPISSLAATKPKSSPPKSSASTRLARWEYGLVSVYGISGGKSAVIAYLPGDRQITMLQERDVYKTLVRMLNLLGNQGWEATPPQKEGNNEWFLKRRK